MSRNRTTTTDMGNPDDAGAQPTTSSQPAETAAPTVRVYSLTGFHRDEVFGVAFVDHPWADVAPDLAQRMVEFRPEVTTKDADGNEVITRGDDPIYSLEAPTPKA